MGTSRWLALSLLAAAPSLFGCGGTLTQAPPDAADADTGSPQDAAEELPAAFIGSVVAASDGSSLGAFSAGFVAWRGSKGPFLDAPFVQDDGSPDGIDQIASCPGVAAGSCCYAPEGFIVPDSLAGQISAGPVTITSGMSTLAVLEPDADGADRYARAMSYPWRPGQALAVSAPGDVIGGFQGTVIAPGPVYGLSPSIGGMQMLSVPRSADLVVNWKLDEKGDSASEQMIISIQRAAAVWCAVGDSAQQLVVPSQLLTMLHAGTADVTLTRLGVTVLSASNASVALAVALETATMVQLQ